MQDTSAARQGMPRPVLLALLGFGAGAAHAAYVSRDEGHGVGRRKRTRLVLRKEAESSARGR